MSSLRRVIDTNVISYIFKENTLATLYKPHLNGFQLVLSFQVLAELREWTLGDGWGERRERKLQDYLRPFVLIHSDERICTHWAEVMGQAKRSGRRMDAADAWIAATALALQCPLVTHNAADFAGIGRLKLITETTP